MFGKSDYNQTKYLSVAGSTTNDDGGVVIPNGEKVGVFRFRANGSDPTAYVCLAWDWGGDSEKIFTSTKGDIDIYMDVSSDINTVTGNGVKKLCVVIINDGMLASPIVGGSFDAVKI